MLAAMNVVAFLLIAMSSGLFLAPSAVKLAKDRLYVAIGLTYFAILATGYVGGLLLALPVALFLFVFVLWCRYVRRTARRILFLVTLFVACTYLLSQVVHLPIRFWLHQQQYLIAANIAGILIALAMSAVCVEMIVRQRGLESATATGLGRV